MASVDSAASEAARIFGRANALRAEAASALVAGDHDRALQLAEEARNLIDPAIQSLAEVDEPNAPAFVRMQQAALVLGELALTYSVLGQPKEAEEPLHQAQLLLGGAKYSVPAAVAGVTRCWEHGEPTYSPDGECQIPPCPQRADPQP